MSLNVSFGRCEIVYNASINNISEFADRELNESNVYVTKLTMLSIVYLLLVSSV